MGEHNHADAFLLMEYATEDGTEREVLWNSRDGVTPFCISSSVTGAEMLHVNWQGDRYAPDHVPKVGDRIFVDMTEQRARALAAHHIEDLLTSGYKSDLEQKYASREAAMADIATNMMSEPDILVVTAGYLEALPVQRVAVQSPLVEANKPAIAVRGERERSAIAAMLDDVPGIYFDRQGKPLSTERYLELFNDGYYRGVALTVLEGDETKHPSQMEHGFFVSTVWLGLNHNHSGGAPLIFETITWRDGQWGERYQYSTEAEALAGHEEILAQSRAELAAERRKKGN